MADFSFGEAIGAGFRLIGRRPLLVLIWAVAYVILVVAPLFAAVAAVLPDLITGYRDAALQLAHNQRPNPATLLALRTHAGGLQPVILVVQIVSRAILMAAIYRAVLEPQNSKWGYLRLSTQELWLGLTTLLFNVMAAVMLLTLFIPISIALGIGMNAAQQGASPGLAALLLLCLVAIVGVGVIVWVLSRLSLALPMSFAQNRFVLYESWALTRGRALKIVLVMLTLVVGMLICEVIAGGLGFRLLAHSLVSHADWRARLQAPAADLARSLLPLLIGVAAVGSLVRMAVYAIMVAPLASIYRQVAGPSAPG